MKCSILRGALVSLVAVVATGTVALGQVNWDGGNGDWSTDLKWNSGKTAQEVFGRTNGLEIGTAGLVSEIVNITSGNVTYDPNANGDFRFKPGGAGVPGGTLNISGGASLSMDSSVAQDGNWTQFDGDALNLNNGTFRRTYSGNSFSGGAMIFGSWRSYANQKIAVNLTNGAKIENHGQVWFGAWDDHATGLEVQMTINNGSLDFTGGLDFELGEKADADWILTSGWSGGNASTGGGNAKKEKYSVNFTGAGSIRTGEGGILNPIQDEFNAYSDASLETLLSYQDLWSRGILQAHGYSGKQGARFDGFFTVEGAKGEADYRLVSKVNPTPQPIVWDGGNGNWSTDAKWNGGKTSQAVIGRNDGFEVGNGEAGFDVHINSGNVVYDPNTFGDFRFKSGGNLHLAGGSTLTMNSAKAPDGNWTEFDGRSITIDNATLRRTASEPSFSGGALILGSWRSYDDQIIDISLTNGGKIENHGQLWFGAYGDNAERLTVNVTIDDGQIDLTGGNSYDLLGEGGEEGGPGNADLVFINGFENGAPKGEKYSINFTGPGSITVDSAGITNPVDSNGDSNPASYGATLTTLLSYEDLWSRGILQAKGLSGNTGAKFTDYFQVTGNVGKDNYTLTSLITKILSGDFDKDGSLTKNDVDLLGAGIVAGGAGSTYDLNGDGAVNQADIGALLQSANKLNGDLDFNNAVEFSDFLILSANFGKAGGAKWSEGNIIAADDSVSFADFLALSANFGQSTSAATAASVPEPASMMLALFGLLGLLGFRRTRTMA